MPSELFVYVMDRPGAKDSVVTVRHPDAPGDPIPLVFVRQEDALRWLPPMKVMAELTQEAVRLVHCKVIDVMEVLNP